MMVLDPGAPPPSNGGSQAVVDVLASPTATKKSKKKKKRRNKRDANLSSGFFFAVVSFGLISLAINTRLLVLPRTSEELVSASQQALKTFLGTNSGRAAKETSKLAGLHCQATHGGPSDDEAAEMVYWQDIPEDSWHTSPFKKPNETQYLTFEADEGGWNNIRMALETVIGLAHATGRTLVLPPENRMYLLSTDKGGNGTQQRNKWTFAHFFRTEDISREHAGLEIITMQEYLERAVVVQGQFRSAATGHLLTAQDLPEPGRTNYDGRVGMIQDWLRRHSSTTMQWERGKCLATFPASTDPSDLSELVQLNRTFANSPPPRIEDYTANPDDVNASTFDRMREQWSSRKQLCLYDEQLQNTPHIHLGNHDSESRLLVHFYAFLFFQDWQHDLWLKRFVRDHIRYTDEIQCAAARVVAAVRKYARQHHNGDATFDTMHIRRGDFQYKQTRIDADKILAQAKKVFTNTTVVFIATDERDKSFFKPLVDTYDVLFLDDFRDELGHHINTNFYGMIDALIASRGRKFIGCWFSTFTGYINRLRGYHAERERYPGFEQGKIPSWYYVPDNRFDEMQVYRSVKPPFWAREFPTGWRLLNTGMHEFHTKQQQQQQKQR